MEEGDGAKLIAAAVFFVTLLISLLLNLKFSVDEQAKADCNLDGILKNLKT